MRQAVVIVPSYHNILGHQLVIFRWVALSSLWFKHSIYMCADFLFQVRGVFAIGQGGACVCQRCLALTSGDGLCDSVGTQEGVDWVAYRGSQTLVIFT